ncbi:MAG: hypothetical protein U0271_26295 [Polyangiaceae bacterium]
MVGRDQDDSVDSGWDDEPAPSTRAVNSVQLLAQAKDSLAATSEVEPFLGDLDGLTLEGEQPPTTRRATDNELRSMTERAHRREPQQGAIRLAGRRIETPVQTPSDELRKSSGSPKPFEPPVETKGEQKAAGLRFSGAALREQRQRRNNTTKVNFAAVNPDALPKGEGADDPLADLRLDDDPRGVPSTARTTTVSSGPAVPVRAQAPASAKGLLPGLRPTLPAAVKAVSAPSASPLLTPAKEAAVPRPPRAGLQPFGEKASTLRAAGTPVSPLATPAKPSSSPATNRSAVAASAPAATRAADPVAPKKISSLSDPELKLDIDDGLDAELGTGSKDAELEADLEFGDDAPLSADEVEALSREGVVLELDPPSISEFSGLDSSPARSAPVAPPAAEDPKIAALRIRFEKGDYAGVLMRAEALLDERPDDTTVREYIHEAQIQLKQMYLEKLGNADIVLRVAMQLNEIQGLSIDNRAGFVISLIDGVATIGDVIDMSGMPELDVLRMLYELREHGVVVVDSMAKL